MWNLLKLDIESVSSARAGGFLPTVPPGESCVGVCVCVCLNRVFSIASLVHSF